MAAERFDDLPALGEIRAAIARELADPAVAGSPKARWRPLSALPVLAAVIVSIAVLLAALSTLHHRSDHGPSQHSAGKGSVRGSRALIDELAVLRRPQTQTDLPSFLMRLTTRPLFAFRGQADTSLIRYATTTPWNARVYIVPFRPASATALAHAHLPGQAHRFLASRGWTVGVFTRGGGGGGANAAIIRRTGAFSSTGSNQWTQLIGLVPDGVASVTFLVPRQPQPGTPFAPTYHSVLSVTSPVHNNIVAVQLDRETGGGAVPMIWRGANGTVIKQIGNFDDLNRVVAPPTPAPATAASRAAERNPATPNRVWVTPAIGGPRTNFRYHFRLLLSDADYRYTLTGPTCPAIHVDGDGGGGASGLRGRIWTDSVSAIQSALWCPGTYHLSAFVSDYGLGGRVSGRVRPANEKRPFGTATFTVRS